MASHKNVALAENLPKFDFGAFHAPELGELW